MAVANDNVATLRDLIKEARTVPAFTGNDTYSLSSYIREVETLVGMVNDENQKAYISRILYAKIQGEAAVSIRRLHNPSWLEVKNQLIKSFGVNESYLKLKEQADQINVKNVSDLYSKLNCILDKLNLKYQLESDSPYEFSPHHNEKSILEKFLNKIDRIDAMFIRTKNIQSLEEAYQALLQTNINSFDKNNYYNKNQTKRNFESDKVHNINNNKSQNFVSNFDHRYPNYRGTKNVDRWNNNFNNNHSWSFNNRNFDNRYLNSRNYKPFGHFNNNYSGNFSNRYSKNTQRTNLEPMEIDYNNIQRTQNFHSTRQPPSYP